jgi:hypothetical protein
MGRLAFGLRPTEALRETALLVLWTAVAIVLARALERRALRVLEIGGG